jgi:hypothetical protein
MTGEIGIQQCPIVDPETLGADPTSPTLPHMPGQPPARTSIRALTPPASVNSVFFGIAIT